MRLGRVSSTDEEVASVAQRRRREATDDKSVVGDDVRRVDEAVDRLRVAASDDNVKRVARTMRRSAHGLNEVKRRQYVRKTRRIPVSRIVDVNDVLRLPQTTIWQRYAATNNTTTTTAIRYSHVESRVC